LHNIQVKRGLKKNPKSISHQMNKVQTSTTLAADAGYENPAIAFGNHSYFNRSNLVNCAGHLVTHLASGKYRRPTGARPRNTQIHIFHVKRRKISSKPANDVIFVASSKALAPEAKSVGSSCFPAPILSVLRIPKASIFPGSSGYFAASPACPLIINSPPSQKSVGVLGARSVSNNDVDLKRDAALLPSTPTLFCDGGDL